MQVNPYQPPDAPLEVLQPADGPSRKRFRFRFIPATLCFVYGGVGLFAILFTIVIVGAYSARFGLSRVNLGPLLLIVAAGAMYCALWLCAGWLLIKGRWLYAVATILTAIATGVVFDRWFGADRHDADRSRNFLNRIIKRE